MTTMLNHAVNFMQEKNSPSPRASAHQKCRHAPAATAIEKRFALLCRYVIDNSREHDNIRMLH
jgi:hypothetical protein